MYCNTSDQFFNEDQLEPYRKLGELIGEDLCSDNDDGRCEIKHEIEQIFGK
jgi:hypothetical protein